MDLAVGGGGPGRWHEAIEWILSQAGHHLTNAALANLQSNLWQAANSGLETIQDIVRDYLPEQFVDALENFAPAGVIEHTNPNHPLHRPEQQIEAPQAQPAPAENMQMEVDQVPVRQSFAMKRGGAPSSGGQAEGEPASQVARASSGGAISIGGGGAGPSAPQMICNPRSQIRSAKVGSVGMRCLIGIRTFSPISAPVGKLTEGISQIAPCIYRFRKTPSMMMCPADVDKVRHLVESAKFKAKFTNIRGSLKAINMTPYYISNDSTSQTAVNNTATCLMGHIQGLEQKLDTKIGGMSFTVGGTPLSCDEKATHIDWQQLQKPKVPDSVEGSWKTLEFGSGEESFQQYKLVDRFLCNHDSKGAVDPLTIPDYGSFFPKESITAAAGEIFKFKHKEADIEHQKIGCRENGSLKSEQYILPHPESSVEIFQTESQPPKDADRLSRIGTGYQQNGAGSSLDLDTPLMTGKFRHPAQGDPWARFLPEEHVMLIPGFTLNPSTTQPITVFCMWEAEADVEMDYSASSYTGQDILQPHVMMRRDLNAEKGYAGVVTAALRLGAAAA